MKIKHLLYFFILIFFSDSIDAKRFKRINKVPRRHYEDLLIIVGIQRELYFPRPIGEFKTNYGEGSFLVISKDNNMQEKKYKLIVKANAGGDGQTTDLWVYDDKGILMVVYHVSVSKENIKRIYDQVKLELKNVEGLKIYKRDNSIVLDGEILLPSDIARIHQIISAYPSVFHIQYKMSPVLFKVIAEKMQKEINNPEIKVEVINTRFVLKGVVYSEGEYEEAVSKAKLLLPQYYYTPRVRDAGGAVRTGSGDLISATSDFSNLPLVSLIKIKKKEAKPKKDIKITVHFVEIAKGFNKNFGFKWMPSLKTDNTNIDLSYQAGANADTSTANGLTTTITGIISNFIPKLSSTLNHNKGRVIQAVAITTMEEQEGNISKKTNYPYTQQTSTGPQTAFAPVGITMKIEPYIEGKEQNIRLGIDITVDQIVSFSDGGVPTTAQNTVSTWLILKGGETAAISGIVQRTSNNNYGNVPDATGDVIINLSRSKNFTSNKSQFVVFVTPEILESASKGGERMMKKFRINKGSNIANE